MASVIEGDSVLAIDVGSASTRAMLFDVVEGRYRFIAIGQSPSTAHAPFNDISAGVVEAIEKLQETTGKTFIDADQRLITSIQEDGSGVETISTSISAGAALKIVIAGLLSDVSLESAKNLAESTYARVVESLSLNDPRKAEEQIDAILKADPDLIIIAGGTDQGASQSLQKLIEIIGLACYLMPDDKRPAIIFAGNQEKDDEVRDLLEPLSSNLQTTSNIRPSITTEDLGPARAALARAFVGIRKKQIPGVEELDMWAGGRALPSVFAEGRIIHLLSKLYGPEKALLSVNLGASAATLSIGFNNCLQTKVYPHLGLGEGISELLQHTSIENIARWLSNDAPHQQISDYIYTKALYPNSIPATEEDLQIEQALGREALRIAIETARQELPDDVPVIKKNLLPLFEIILAGGSIISNAPTYGQSLLILLDALQPTGTSTLILDQNNLLPALGTAAEINSILPVQALESGAFVNLATAVSPLSSARYGANILKASIKRADGSISTTVLKQGGFEVIPLKAGQVADLNLQPQNRANIGYGPGRKIAMKVGGSALGIVLDGRGRPLDLQSDDNRRKELIKKWLWTVGD
ncbi:MAG: glutamate mutase L [Anaerolineales bacterium]|uniref:Glutamate mutase L n=1 Tax=Candidatus Desulfolinea nitratireducens TaxID=2841698 RepID=A0A8J6NN80_9CHLR|nr:glutamate mutase L [Candidatus Desulfolinea nitratireducens]MBL6960495.1 glutamate mutase L [Anaerolineales bacterium]